MHERSKWMVVFLFTTCAGCQSSLHHHLKNPFKADWSFAASPAPRQSMEPEMSEQIVERRSIAAPKSHVWAVLADYENIHHYTSEVKHSALDAGPACGVGAVRTCSVMMGMKIREEVLDWQEGESYTISIDSPMPTKDHRVTLHVRELSPTTSELTMTASYGTKGWLLGDAMNALMMRSMMKKAMTGILRDIDTAVTTQHVAAQTPSYPQAVAEPQAS